MKITNYIPVILCSIALCGCSDAAKTVGFGTDSDAIEAPATGGTHTVRVSAEKEWVATTDEPWITVSPANGRGTTECRVLIDSALTDQPRRGVIRIMEQNTWVKKEIAVSQKGFDYLIGIDDQGGHRRQLRGVRHAPLRRQDKDQRGFLRQGSRIGRKLAQVREAGGRIRPRPSARAK